MDRLFFPQKTFKTKYTLQELRGLRKQFAKYIQSKAKVINEKIGFVSIEEVNHFVNPSLLNIASEITKKTSQLPSLVFQIGEKNLQQSLE